jgi:hypothetical protein
LDIVTLIATGITAAATVAIAIFAIPTIQAYRKQVQIGQAQVKVSQEQTRVSQDQQFNQFRPVLHPVGDLGPLVKMVDGKSFIQWGIQNQVIEGLRNIGVGPAFNIYGIIFGPPLITTPPKPPRDRYVVWNYPALSPGQKGDKITLQQFTHVSSETAIGGYPLYVPNDADHIGIIARFTLTYHDVFNRKHASIYDYHAQYGWMCRGHFPKIEHDIRELDRQTPGTRQAEQFWIAAGQRAQP